MFPRLAIIAAVVLASFAGRAGERAAYRLASGDEIRLVVLDAPQYSGTFRVAEDGAIAFVPAGRLKLEGMSIPEATVAVRTSLSGQVVNPSVSLEIVRHRSFYILGDVASPGAFPATPGLTVIQAVALAGGFKPRGDFLQASVFGIRAAESLSSARTQIVEARVRLARVEAELAERDGFEPPSGPEMSGGSASLAELVASERKVLEIRVAGFAKQMELLERERTFRDEELKTLEARRASQMRESEQLKAEIREVRDLVAKGLSPTSRMNALNRDEIRNQGDILQTNIFILNSRQARNQAELAISNLVRDRRLQLLAEEQDVTGRIKRLRIQARADEAVVLDASGEGRQLSAPVTKASVVRRGETLPADDGLAIEPGDVVRIDRRGMTAAVGQ